MSSATIISHSEVDTFLLCEQRHYYAFGDNDGKGLEPHSFSDSLYRGIVGHKGLEMTFKALQEGSSLTDAADVGIKAINEFGLKPDAKFGILTDLTQSILPRYFAEMLPQWMNRGWKVAAVEKTFRLQVPTAFGLLEYPFTPDLILQSPVQEFHVVDHKFVYNFYTADAIDLLPQIPKYTGSLRALGKPITGGIYNMIRWRPVKDDTLNAHYRTVDFVPSNTRIRHAFQTQVETMLEIKKRKEGENSDWKKQVHTRRVQNNMICKSCPFKTICTLEMNGGNVELMKRVNFKDNSYGYGNEVEQDA